MIIYSKIHKGNMYLVCGHTIYDVRLFDPSAPIKQIVDAIKYMHTIGGEDWVL